jgi:hypothetical protein
MTEQAVKTKFPQLGYRSSDAFLSALKGTVAFYSKPRNPARVVPAGYVITDLAGRGKHRSSSLYAHSGVHPEGFDHPTGIADNDLVAEAVRSCVHPTVGVHHLSQVRNHI